MKQCPVVGSRRRILDHQRAGGERGRNLGFAERAPRNHAGARHSRPHHRQMGFAGALRPHQRDRVRRPIRPAIHQRKRLFVARSGQKILARKALGVIERERELVRVMSHVTQLVRSPV